MGGRITKIGIIGGGQLAWMLGLAAQELNLELFIQTPHVDDVAVRVAQDVVYAPVDDAQATARLAEICQVIGWENEFINVPALARLEGVLFRPDLSVLEPILDKYSQRCYFKRLGLPNPGFRLWSDPPTDYPIVLKARRHGYDGRGTLVIHNPKQYQEITAPLVEQMQNLEFVQEEFVDFAQELAIVGARDIKGNIITYPLVETQQVNQVCRRVFAPAAVPSEIATQAQVMLAQVFEDLQAVGVMAIELFLTKTGRLLINEIAPRVHNSAHWTIEGCQTSQFSQHLRALTGLELASVAPHSPHAVMVNLLGYETSRSDYLDKRQRLAAIPHSRLYWYGKTAASPGRKLGHITALTQSRPAAETLAQEIEALWYS